VLHPGYTRRDRAVMRLMTFLLRFASPRCRAEIADLQILGLASAAGPAQVGTAERRLLGLLERTGISA
jgi:hypothetical protein